MCIPFPDCDTSTNVSGHRSRISRAHGFTAPPSIAPSRSMHPTPSPSAYPRPAPTCDAFASANDDQVRDAVDEARRPFTCAGSFVTFSPRGTNRYRIHRSRPRISAGNTSELRRARYARCWHAREQYRAGRPRPSDTGIAAPHSQVVFMPTSLPASVTKNHPHQHIKSHHSVSARGHPHRRHRNTPDPESSPQAAPTPPSRHQALHSPRMSDPPRELSHKMSQWELWEETAGEGVSLPGGCAFCRAGVDWFAAVTFDAVAVAVEWC